MPPDPVSRRHDGPGAGDPGARGLSLVEVLVSLAILAFISMGLIILVSMSMHLVKLGQERTIATALASQRLIQITSMPFQGAADFALYGLPEEAGSPGPPPILTTAYGDLPGYPEYRREVLLDYGSPHAGMLTVRVAVFWQHPKQGERSHTMVSYVHSMLD